MTHQLLIYSQRKSTSLRQLLFYWQTRTFGNRGGKGLRSHYCWYCNKLLEMYNWSQERDSGGVNEESEYVKRAACLGQQDLSVLCQRAEDIERLSQHPQIILQIEVMKTEVITYQTVADSIKPCGICAKKWWQWGRIIWHMMSDWWKTNGGKLQAFTYVWRAVFTNSPNSCRPECSSVTIFQFNVRWRSKLELSYRLHVVIDTVKV
jgi:hypothetical protein